MLKKEYRLKKKTAFTATYKTGNIIHGKGITLFYGKRNITSQPTKVGFVVSKKISKRAVKRNRIKRLMRESYRLIIKNKIENNTYMSLIFVASSNLIKKDFKYIDLEIKKILAKI